MQVTASSFTVAEYCEQMRERSIVVNHDYQRSERVWPPAARSYLIDRDLALSNLTALSAALEEPATYPQFSDFVKACSKATNRIDPRKTPNM